MRSMPAPPLLRPEPAGTRWAADTRAAFAMLRAGASAALAERAALLGRAVFYLLVMVVLSTFWDVVASDHVAGSLVTKLPAQGLMLYVGVTEWITLSVPAVHLRLEDDFRRGGIESRLLLPPSPLLMRIAEAAGSMLVRMAVLGATALAAYSLTAHPGITPAAWAAVLTLGLLGGLIGLLLHTLVGLTSVWLRNCVPVFLVMQKASFLFGGLVAPVTLYPGWLEAVSVASPFGAHLYWPAALAIAEPQALAGMAALALSAQAVWLVLLSSAIALLWRRGLRRMLREGV